MSWRSVDILEVVFHGGGEPRPVGRLAYRNRRAWFEYDREWLRSPMPLSPVGLPAGAGVLGGPATPFEGLFGVFHDSLPDGWGRLLLDREVRRQGYEPGDLSPLDRLAWIGDRGMGALEYRPAVELAGPPTIVDLGELAAASGAILTDADSERLGELLLLGGSPHGARPKVLVGVSPDRQRLAHAHGAVPDGYEPWIVKFRAAGDESDSGRLELCWSRLAARCGLTVPEAHLFETTAGDFFGSRRFDRIASRHVHVQTFAALWHVDIRTPSLDAKDLLRAVRWLTQDRREVERAVRWIAFNILAHNRDDHAKNIAFQLDDAGTWTLTPAYDLTLSDGPGGEHWLSVGGEGRFPTLGHLIRAAEPAGVSSRVVKAIAEDVCEGMTHFEAEARTLGISPTRIAEVARRLRTVGSRFL